MDSFFSILSENSIESEGNFLLQAYLENAKSLMNVDGPDHYNSFLRVCNQTKLFVFFLCMEDSLH